MRIAVTGHRGLCPDVSTLIEQAIGAELDRIEAAGAELTGLSCLADGADQIFATAVVQRGGRLEVVIPARTYREVLPRQARGRYDTLCRQASRVHRLDHQYADATAHMQAGAFLVDHAERVFAIWDGRPPRAYGGTADVVSYARGHGVPVTVIWPPGARRD